MEGVGGGGGRHCVKVRLACGPEAHWGAGAQRVEHGSYTLSAKYAVRARQLAVCRDHEEVTQIMHTPVAPVVAAPRTTHLEPTQNTARLSSHRTCCHGTGTPRSHLPAPSPQSCLGGAGPDVCTCLTQHTPPLHRLAFCALSSTTVRVPPWPTHQPTATRSGVRSARWWSRDSRGAGANQNGRPVGHLTVYTGTLASQAFTGTRRQRRVHE